MFKIAYLLVACVLLFSVSVSANDKSGNDGPSKAFIQNQSASIVQYRGLLDLTDDSDYGGMYIDENGVLNVLVVDNAEVQAAVNSVKSSIKQASATALSADELYSKASAAEVNSVAELAKADNKFEYDKETLQRAEIQQIIIKPAAYSKEYLDSIQTTLEDYMEQLDIVLIGVDEIDNRVDVDMLDVSDEIIAEIEELIGKSGISACSFEEVPERPKTNYSVTNASSVYKDLGNGYGNFYSLGVGATVDGRPGWLICGHGLSVGDTIYATGCNSPIGRVTNQHLGSYGDFAFIERTSMQYTITNKIVDASDLRKSYYWGMYEDGPYVFSQGLSWGFPVGTYVEKFGQTTGKTGGFIKKLNGTADYDEGRVKNLIWATYDSAGGDSGSPITVYLADGRYRTVIGIHSGSGYRDSFERHMAFFTDMEDLVERITTTHNVQAYAQ